MTKHMMHAEENLLLTIQIWENSIYSHPTHAQTFALYCSSIWKRSEQLMLSLMLHGIVQPLWKD